MKLKAIFMRSQSHVGIFVTGTPVKNNSTGAVEYQMEGPLQFLVWYHAVGLIWISEFILAFQQMTIAGAVVTYYFTRYKTTNCIRLAFLAHCRCDIKS